MDLSVHWIASKIDNINLILRLREQPRIFDLLDRVGEPNESDYKAKVMKVERSHYFGFTTTPAVLFLSRKKKESTSFVIPQILSLIYEKYIKGGYIINISINFNFKQRKQNIM